MTASGAAASGAARRSLSRASRSFMSRRTSSYIAAAPRSRNSLSRRPARASGLARQKQLHRGIGADHRADVAAVENGAPGLAAVGGSAGAPRNRAASPASYRAPPGAQRGSRQRGRPPRPQPRIAEKRRRDPARRRDRRARIGRIGALLEDEQGGRAVELAGVEIGECQIARRGGAPGCPCRKQPGRRSRRQTGGARSSPPRGGKHHCCWGSLNLAPIRLISGTKSGKLVAIGRASSIRTGSRAASPSTRNAIAMR